MQHAFGYRTPGGFSIVEFLVAFTILTIAALGLVHVSSSTVTGNIGSADQAAAMALGVQKIEELKRQTYSSLLVAAGAYADPNQLTAAGSPGVLFSREWLIESVTVPNGVGTVAGKRLTVTVRWTGGSSEAVRTTIVDPAALGSALGSDFFPTVSVKAWKRSG